MDEYRTKAYAKINLGLDVVKRLPNGAYGQNALKGHPQEYRHTWTNLCHTRR